jgi:UDP-glucose 4-epimerase
MKILLTGGTGFIGQHLARALVDNGYEVNCLARNPELTGRLPSNVNVFYGDLSKNRELSKCMDGVDVVIHVAAQLGHYGIPRETYYEVNYRATVDLLEMAIEHRVSQFIFCSAPFVVGLGERLSSEDAPYAPKGDYSESKVLAEKSIQEKSAGKIHYTILRTSYVYGPGDTRRVLLYKGIMRRRFVLTTNGKAHLQPTYVSDIVDGFLLAIKNEKAYEQIINLGGEECTVQDYLECIANAVGSRLIKINIGYLLSILGASVVDFISRLFFGKPGFVTKSRIDFLSLDHSCKIDKAERLLNYKPQVSLQKGIDLTIRWAREQGYL